MKHFISFASFSDEFQKLSSSEKVPLARANARIFNALLKGAPVKVRVTEEANQFGGGFFDIHTKEIGLSEKSYEVLAHELGHAELDKHLLGRIIQSQAARTLSGVVPSVLAGIGAGILMAKGKKWGLLLPAALSAPTLLSEFLATRKGGKLLRDAGATEEQQEQYRRNTNQGLGTYFKAPALGTLVASAR